MTQDVALRVAIAEAATLIHAGVLAHRILEQLVPADLQAATQIGAIAVRASPLGTTPIELMHECGINGER